MSTEPQNQNQQPHQRAIEVDPSHIMTREHYERLLAELEAEQE